MSDTDNNVNMNESASQDQLLSDILARFSQHSSPPPPQQPSSSGGNTDILSALLSNKELISKLPQIISVAKPIFELMGSSPALKTEHTEKSTSSALPAYPAASARSKSEADRVALLCAMKPYLSRDRQNAIDYVIKLSRLGDILKTL